MGGAYQGHWVRKALLSTCMHFDPECLRFCFFGFYICLPSKSHTPNTYYGSDTLFECFLTKNEIVLNSLQHSSTL